MTGKELLQELLASCQLGHAQGKLVHTLLEVTGRRGPVQQAILQAGEAAPIAPPSRAEYDGAGDGRAECGEEDDIIHRLRRLGMPRLTAISVTSFARSAPGERAPKSLNESNFH